jgi:DNA-binding transcriptional MerR regulator
LEKIAVMGRARLKMATVTRLTGFKPELLRAWESRHQLLAPARGMGGQRLYSDQDVAVLLGVRALLAEGRSIGEIVLLGRRELAELADRARPASEPPPVIEAPRVEAPRALQIATNAVSRLSAHVEPQQLMGLVVDTLASDFQAALARIWVAEPEGQVLILRASAGLSRQTTRSSRARIDLRTYRFKVGVVGRSGQPFVSNHIVGDPDFDQRWVRTERLASVAVLPMVAEGRILGVLASFYRIALNEEVLGGMRMFAQITASCLEAHAARQSKSPTARWFAA